MSSDTTPTQEVLYALADELLVLIDHANTIRVGPTRSARRLAGTLVDLFDLASDIDIAVSKHYMCHTDVEGLADPTSALLADIMERCSQLSRSSSNVTCLEYHANGIQDLTRANPPYPMAVAWQEWYDPLDSGSVKTGEEIGQELVRWMEKQIKKCVYHTGKLTEMGARLKADKEVAEGAKDAMKSVLHFYRQDHSKLTNSERQKEEHHWLKVAVEASEALETLE